MKQLTKVVLLLGIICCINACKTESNTAFKEIYGLIKQENFFKADDLYSSNKKEISPAYRKFTEAILDNAFNRLEESQEKTDFLIRKRKSIPDSLMVKLYEVKKDNSLKLFNYMEAMNAVSVILENYKEYLTDTQLTDFENDLKLYSALKDVSPERVVIRDNSVIKTKKDMAGLNTLQVVVNDDSLDFIFDTGANFSTTSESMAEQLKMEIIHADINVGTATSQKVLAQLAVCKKLTFGNIDVYDAVFLVVPDELLSFPEDGYQIFGILGYPVMQALNEIHITQDNRFIVPKEQTAFTDKPNVAMDGLMMMINIDGRPYRFDTGANSTVLYYKYFLENQKEIEQNYQLKNFAFAGAGGKEEFEGYEIDVTFNVSGKDVTLKNVELLTNTIYDDETYYGNIGQDLIRQFDTMILNFRKMYICFE